MPSLNSMTPGRAPSHTDPDRIYQSAIGPHSEQKLEGSKFLVREKNVVLVIYPEEESNRKCQIRTLLEIKEYLAESSDHMINGRKMTVDDIEDGKLAPPRDVGRLKGHMLSDGQMSRLQAFQKDLQYAYCTPGFQSNGARRIWIVSWKKDHDVRCTWTQQQEIASALGINSFYDLKGWESDETVALPNPTGYQQPSINSSMPGQYPPVYPTLPPEPDQSPNVRIVPQVSADVQIVSDTNQYPAQLNNGAQTSHFQTQGSQHQHLHTPAQPQVYNCPQSMSGNNHQHPAEHPGWNIAPNQSQQTNTHSVTAAQSQASFGVQPMNIDSRQSYQAPSGHHTTSHQGQHVQQINSPPVAATQPQAHHNGQTMAGNNGRHPSWGPGWNNAADQPLQSIEPSDLTLQGKFRDGMPGMTIDSRQSYQDPFWDNATDQPRPPFQTNTQPRTYGGMETTASNSSRHSSPAESWQDTTGQPVQPIHEINKELGAPEDSSLSGNIVIHAKKFPFGVQPQNGKIPMRTRCIVYVENKNLWLMRKYGDLERLAQKNQISLQHYDLRRGLNDPKDKDFWFKWKRNSLSELKNNTTVVGLAIEDSSKNGDWFHITVLVKFKGEIAKQAAYHREREEIGGYDGPFRLSRTDYLTVGDIEDLRPEAERTLTGRKFLKSLKEYDVENLEVPRGYTESPEPGDLAEYWRTRCIQERGRADGHQKLSKLYSDRADKYRLQLLRLGQDVEW